MLGTDEQQMDTAFLAAESPPNQRSRLAALRSYGILDTPVEAAFEDITRIASYVCRTPIAVVNLIDEARQWFKSETGLGVRETPLDTSICAHALLLNDFMEIPDTLLDPRFNRNPLVTGEPHLRFYAGALLKTPEGHALGTVCVLDTQPRHLSDEQRDTLRALARQTMAQFELRRALADSERAYRYRGRLMAIAGHDLKQPLSVLTMVLDMLAANVTQPADVHRIELAHEATQRLNLELSDLARASRLDEDRDAMQLQRVDLAELLWDVVDGWMHAADRKGLELKLDAIEAQIFTHPSMLRTILDNLIGNAIKYTMSGSVGVRCRDTQEGIWIDVADNGPGIPAGLRAEIFEAFRQLDPKAEGLGLGLSIVKNTAEMLGCDLNVDCGEGGGATFSVRVPKDGGAMSAPEA